MFLKHSAINLWSKTGFLFFERGFFLIRIQAECYPEQKTRYRKIPTTTAGNQEK